MPGALSSRLRGGTTDAALLGPSSTAEPARPLGATPCRDGVNFSVFSKHATGVELLLFDRVDDAQPARVIRIDPVANRTTTTGMCSSLA